MSQHEPAVAADTRTLTEDEPRYTAADLAAMVGRSRWWVVDQVQRGLIDHVRMGPQPPEGTRESRPIMFTEGQARAVQARVHHYEVVPSQPREQDDLL